MLAAAPATPVQLAHACLLRGFSVAIPASWGDELIAAESVRRLVARDKGPAVMCVCPYVRARLLAPGPDLAPFLVSLVSPPVAAARYLRSVYGEHGVHITYVGGCPGADDPAIDDRLTPNAFLAELAERGISLSEQPLVFDSIVPPDRRRWCSLPGGVPSAEVLWNETDARTLVEIDPDDVSTDLAQHIITREHVLLDLAPSLGCVCSGAVPTLSSRSARVAVAALEPPRALGPVVDPATVVPLDAPVGSTAIPTIFTEASRPADEPASHAAPTPLEGGPREPERADAVVDATDGPMGGVRAEISVAAEVATAESADDAADSDAPAPEAGADVLDPDVPTVALAGGVRSERASGDATGFDALSTESASAAPAGPPPLTTTRSPATVHPDSETTSGVGGAARRAPHGSAVRHPTGSIPRAAGGDGRSLPRAYAAKRRTPPAGMSRIGTSTENPATPVASAPVRRAEADAPPLRESVGEPAAPVNGRSPTYARPASSRSASSLPPTTSTPTGNRPASDAPPPSPESDTAAHDEARGGSFTAVRSGSPTARAILLIAALLTLGVFVLMTLRR